MIKFLTLSDLPACTEISALKSRTAGTVPLTMGGFIDAYEKYFNNDEHYRAIGYFKNDTLVSFLFISLFENNMRGKFWVIPGLYTKEFNNYFTFNRAEIRELFTAAFNYTESMGWYEYYYCTAERVMNVYERQWKKSQSHRYEHILLDVVPPNTKPFYELYWRLMGQQVKPAPMVFKKRVLKHEFRNTIEDYK
jgi:hypothetical protein